MRSTKSTTIYDIARKAGVSPATVSMALNDKGNVSQKTKAFIKSIAEKLNYEPNQIARMLKNQKTNQIMLSMADMRNDFYYDVIQSVNKVTKNNDYSLLLNYNEMNSDIELKMLGLLKQNHIDGLIMLSIFLNDSIVKEINSSSKPIVLSTITAALPENINLKCDFVGVDTKRAMYLATKKLIDQGHKKIAYVGLHIESPTGLERFEGYKQALKENDIFLDYNNIYLGGYTSEFGYGKVMEISQKPLPSAICATSDVIASGVYRALAELKIDIPSGMSVIGIDNSDICTMLKPNLSSVSIEPHKIGQVSAELLLKRIQNPEKPLESIVFSPQLFERESTK